MEEPTAREAFDWTCAFESNARMMARAPVEPPLPDAREVLRLADLERLGMLAPDTF